MAGNAALIFLPRHKTAILGSGAPPQRGWRPVAPAPPLRRENLLSHTTRKRGVNGDGNLEIFLQIFFHALNPAFHGAADGTLVHALLAGDLTVALSKDQMSYNKISRSLRREIVFIQLFFYGYTSQEMMWKFFVIMNRDFFFAKFIVKRGFKRPLA